MNDRLAKKKNNFSVFEYWRRKYPEHFSKTDIQRKKRIKVLETFFDSMLNDGEILFIELLNSLRKMVELYVYIGIYIHILSNCSRFYSHGTSFFTLHCYIHLLTLHQFVCVTVKLAKSYPITQTHTQQTAANKYHLSEMVYFNESNNITRFSVRIWFYLHHISVYLFTVIIWKGDNKQPVYV